MAGDPNSIGFGPLYSQSQRCANHSQSDDGDIVKDLIDTRLNDIKKGRGIITKITPQYRGGKSRDNKKHSLIGADGKYTRIDTIFGSLAMQ